MSSEIDYTPLVGMLLDPSTQIETIIETCADQENFSRISGNFLKTYTPIRFLCSCTCEGLLCRSHFFSTTILNILCCMERLAQYRLGNGPEIELQNIFNGTSLSDEPLFVVPKERIVHTGSTDVNALSILNEILGNFNKSPDNKFGKHPYKLYWFLVEELKVNIGTASKHHSTQGLLRIIINYLIYRNKPNVSEHTGNYPSVSEIKEWYEKAVTDMRDKDPIILPYGVEYEFKEVNKILKTFFYEVR